MQGLVQETLLRIVPIRAAPYCAALFRALLRWFERQ